MWLVGGGGLLGSHVSALARRSGRQLHRSQVPWTSQDQALDVLCADADALLSQEGALDLVWCAGAGVVATSREDLNAEVALLDRFVGHLTTLVSADTGSAATLRVFLASSAGGVYGGSADPPFDESTPPRPLAPYGEAKLAAESSMARLAEHGVSVLIARIANLYGPGQNLSKPQGLITQLCRAQIQRSPLQMYVSLDTARDYLFVRDAAQMVLAGMDRLADEPAGTVVTKILASHAPTTLATIIGELRRISHRRPPIVLGSSPHTSLQSPDLRFTSRVWPELDVLAHTTLPEGIAATLESVAAHLRAPAGSR